MAWYHRVLNLARPERLSRELDRELEFHVAELTDELIAGGMSEEEARRRARVRFGNPVVQKERTRERDVLPWLESLGADVRYALRSLRANPGFATVAVLSLGLGIGANTAIFSLIDAVMLRSLPVERPEELVVLSMEGEGNDWFTNPIWEAVRDREEVFSGAFAVTGREFDLARGGGARPVQGAMVSGAFFGTLGVRPAAGRLLGPPDDRRGCPGVAVLSHAFWRSAYGGRADAVGRTLSLDGKPFEIVGVAAAGFSGVEVGKAPQVYAPLCAKAVLDGGDSMLDQRSYWFLRIMGRRRPEMTPAELDARLRALAPEVFAATVPTDWEAEPRRGYLANTLRAAPAANGYSGFRLEYGQALLAMMGVVGVVLLIACANVANLLVARAAARRREVAIRLAIGAGRGRLVRQHLTESLLLSLLGAGVGLLLALYASRWMVRALAPRGQAVWLDLSPDGRLLLFTAAVASATAVLFGVVPAWRSSGVDPQAALKATQRGIAEGHSRLSAGKALVVGQIALSMVLVVAAGLLLGTLRRLATLDPGFREEGVLLVSVDMRNAGYEREEAAVAAAAMLEAARSAPGVLSASASQLTPVSGMAWNGPIEVAGFTPRGERDAFVFFNAVTDGFFATLGTPLLAGRDFVPADGSGSRPVVIVNETLAKRFFRGRDPLGRSLVVPAGVAGPTATSYEVVGVVRDVKYRSLREDPTPIVYQPMPFDGTSFVLELRGSGPASALVPAATAAVGEVNGRVALRFTTLADQVSASLSLERMLAVLTALFGLLALLLALVGLYGTMAYAVARRRNEIGVRIALGAARARVVRLVLGEVGRMVVVGLLFGALGAYAAARAMAPFLFGLTPADPATWGLSALVLASVAMAAGALPAWRAATVDPTSALREE